MRMSTTSTSSSRRTQTGSSEFCFAYGSVLVVLTNIAQLRKLLCPPERVHVGVCRPLARPGVLKRRVPPSPPPRSLLGMYPPDSRRACRYPYNEQDGLTHLILAHPHVAKHIGIVPQSMINVYPADFKDGDFLVHFAGCRNSGKDCDKMFVDFWNRRTPIGPAEKVPRA